MRITRREPDALLQSLLDWFDQSRFVTTLLELGRERKPQIEETLEVLVDGYDDPSIPETLPRQNWPETAGGRVAGDVDDLTLALLAQQADNLESDASTLRAAAEVYRRAGEIDRSDQLEEDAEKRTREASRFRLAVSNMQESLGKKLPEAAAGAKGRWLTPVLSALEHVLREVDGRLELLAQLVREIEGLPTYSAENVRSRLNAHKRRSDRN